ncbi:hypothetical protein H4R18_005010 [Coemansia javaensis]|uniref:Uncharacterized protein n=1 Tax=Coemansia javaensis TaxID=2761396 RepID=A0A9W8HAI9_9FUNG|nr:hypothetical protein H4R18_005010 [Coemansia javaensis]
MRLAPRIGPGLAGRRYHRAGARKELANVPLSSWKPGGAPPSPHSEPGTLGPRRAHGPPVGPFTGNAQHIYADAVWRHVPAGTELEAALKKQPLSRAGIRFNPWSLVLELLDDPRLEYTAGGGGGGGGAKALLAAIVRLGWSAPRDVLNTRANLARYLMNRGVFGARAQAQGGGHSALTAAQAMALSQMQWPRQIAERYAARLSVPAAAALRGADSAQAGEWRRTWLAVSVGMLELRTAFVLRRVLFNVRMTPAEQTALVMRGALEHAPGLALNAILAWRGNLAHILAPRERLALDAACFGSAEAARRTVAQAWQLYDWLVHACPHRPAHAPTMVPKYFSPGLAPRDPAVKCAWTTPAASLYRVLCKFDAWDEAARAHSALPDGTDRRLLERYAALLQARRQHSGAAA